MIAIDDAGRIECVATGGASTLDGIITLFHVPLAEKGEADELATPAPPSSNSSPAGAVAATAAAAAAPLASASAVQRPAAFRRVVLSELDKAVLREFALKRLEVPSAPPPLPLPGGCRNPRALYFFLFRAQRMRSIFRHPLLLEVVSFLLLSVHACQCLSSSLCPNPSRFAAGGLPGCVLRGKP